MRHAARARRSSLPWTGFRKVLAITMMLQQLMPLGALAAPLNQTGRWSTSSDIDVAGTHVVLLREPQTNASKVFMFGESGYAQKMRLWRFFASSTLRLPKAASTDSASLFVNLPHPDGLDDDLFCSGHTVLPDGRMLLLGGSWTPPSACGQVFALDPAWFPNADTSMHPWKQQAAMAVERWYATATMLPNGQALATAGTAHSTAIGFGGDQGPDSATYRNVMQPLSISGRFAWADPTVVPGQATDPQPRNAPKDFYTFGLPPVGRDGHAFLADSKGRAVLMGGLLKRAPKDSVLSDAWLMESNIVGDDSTHTWRHMVVVGDSNLAGAIPAPRHHFAATWAGVEDRAASQEIGAVDSNTCYIHGGLDSTGHVLGDLWRGHKINAINSGFNWVWTRLLADNQATARYGHTMSFDPGPHPANEANSAQYARLVIFGGKVAPGTLADNHLYTFGVGRSTTVQQDYHAWRDVAPVSGADGAPVAREGHTSVVRQTVEGDDNGVRQIYFFGGQDANRTVVAPDLWYVSRPDTIVADSALIDPSGPTGPIGYKWKKVPVNTSSTATPTGRWRPAMAYNLASKRMVIVGGDTNGSNIPGGLTNEILTVPIAENVSQTYGLWTHPVMRDPPAHPALPPIAGFQMFGLMNAGEDIARNLEVFNPAGTSLPLGSCAQKPGGWSAASRTTDSLSERPIQDYPFMFVLPDGRLFHAGPAPPGDPDQNPYRRFYDLQSKLWSNVPSSGQTDAIVFGSAAMYRPGRILRAGTRAEGQHDWHGVSNTDTISISSGGTQAWQPYVPGVGLPTLLSRTDHNLTLLPTGDVLASGGLGATPDTTHAVKRPQIWRVADGRWSDPGTAFDPGVEWLASDPYIRNYHSTAILLPDGRVMTAGGEQPNTGRATASIYEPPYLFDAGDTLAARPGIQDGPETMPYARTFTVLLSNTTPVGSIKSVALLRPGAVTHGFDQNQRYVPLGFVALSNPARLLVQTPANANIAPPGEYMLFVVGSASTTAGTVPSIAKWVRVQTVTGEMRDSLDVLAPRGGSYLALSDVSGCNVNAAFYLGWTAPGDDDSIFVSGPATSYNLRYKLNSSSETNFNAWTPLATSAPLLAHSAETLGVTGLSAAVWYRFQMTAVDDNANTSLISNALVARPQYCDDGSGGGFSAQRAGAGQSSVQSASAPTMLQGNSMFSGVPLGSPGVDALRLEQAPRLSGGTRFAYVFPGHARGVSLDRVQLVAADYGSGSEIVASTDGRFVAGVRVTASQVRDHLGRDLLVQASGQGAEPVYADSGEVLTVTLPAATDTSQRCLLLEISGGGGLTGGIAIEALGSAGDSTQLAVIHPRRHWSTQAVPVPASGELRLHCGGAYALRFVGGLSGAVTATTSVASLTAATTASGVDWTAAARDLDGHDAVVAARDTLLLRFNDVPADTNLARDWYLVLDGMPLSAQVAAYRAGRVSHEGQAVLAFRLLPNVPNPFRHATGIRFELPTGGEARLEIFDPQGRLVRRFAGHYEAGRHEIQWDLRDARGSAMAAGIYVYRLKAGGQEARRKMVVLP